MESKKGRPPIKDITIVPINKKHIETDIFTYIDRVDEVKVKVLPTTDKPYKPKQLQREHILKTLRYNDIYDESIAVGGDPLTVKAHIEKFINYCIEENKNYKDYHESYYNYLEIGQQRGWTI